MELLEAVHRAEQRLQGPVILALAQARLLGRGGERIAGLGAHRVDIRQGDQKSWVVLAVPEGNEFLGAATGQELVEFAD